MSSLRILSPETTAAVILGAHDWSDGGLGRARSFRRSAKDVFHYLIDSAGLGLDPAVVIDLFDSRESAGEQLTEVRDTLHALLKERGEEGRPMTDVLIYYVGHGQTDDQGHLSFLVRRSRQGMEAETSIRALDLARVLKVAAPQQRRIVVLDCCFSEAAAKAFVGMSASLEQAVAATAAKDFRDEAPHRGTLLLCSSPVGEVSMAPSGASRTLFTGAVLGVLREGIPGGSPDLTLADLRDAAWERMLTSFGANAPRPVLHQTNATQGDLTRVPVFPNRSGRTQGETPEARESLLNQLREQLALQQEQLVAARQVPLEVEQQIAGHLAHQAVQDERIAELREQYQAVRSELQKQLLLSEQQKEVRERLSTQLDRAHMDATRQIARERELHEATLARLTQELSVKSERLEQVERSNRDIAQKFAHSAKVAAAAAQREIDLNEGHEKELNKLREVLARVTIQRREEESIRQAKQDNWEEERRLLSERLASHESARHDPQGRARNKNTTRAAADSVPNDPAARAFKEAQARAEDNVIPEAEARLRHVRVLLMLTLAIVAVLVLVLVKLM